MLYIIGMLFIGSAIVMYFYFNKKDKKEDKHRHAEVGIGKIIEKAYVEKFGLKDKWASFEIKFENYKIIAFIVYKDEVSHIISKADSLGVLSNILKIRDLLKSIAPESEIDKSDIGCLTFLRKDNKNIMFGVAGLSEENKEFFYREELQEKAKDDKYILDFLLNKIRDDFNRTPGAEPFLKAFDLQVPLFYQDLLMKNIDVIEGFTKGLFTAFTIASLTAKSPVIDTKGTEGAGMSWQDYVFFIKRLLVLYAKNEK